MNYLFGIGAQEMIFIVIVLLLLFGGSKLPQLMRGAGKGIREFKDAVDGKIKYDDDKESVEAKKKDE